MPDGALLDFAGNLDGTKPLHRITAWVLLVVFGLPVLFAVMRLVYAVTTGADADLAGRPGEVAPGQQVQVGVEDGLAGGGAGVEHQPVVVVALGGGARRPPS